MKMSEQILNKTFTVEIKGNDKGAKFFYYELYNQFNINTNTKLAG